MKKQKITVGQIFSRSKQAGRLADKRTDIHTDCVWLVFLLLMSNRLLGHSSVSFLFFSFLLFFSPTTAWSFVRWETTALTAGCDWGERGERETEQGQLQQTALARRMHDGVLSSVWWERTNGMDGWSWMGWLRPCSENLVLMWSRLWPHPREREADRQSVVTLDRRPDRQKKMDTVVMVVEEEQKQVAVKEKSLLDRGNTDWLIDCHNNCCIVCLQRGSRSGMCFWFFKAFFLTECVFMFGRAGSLFDLWLISALY